MNKSFLNILLDGYENRVLKSYKNATEDFKNLEIVKFKDLKNFEITGPLKACYYDKNNELSLAFATEQKHTLIAAATGAGKTTSFVLPTIIATAISKNKSSLVITDPKGEIYDKTSGILTDNGYKVFVYDINDLKISDEDGTSNSELWNPLSSIYRKFQEAFDIDSKIEIVKTKQGLKYKMFGKIYDDEQGLKSRINTHQKVIFDEVNKKIEDLAASLILIPPGPSDPYWDRAARSVLMAFLWALLEDSRPELKNTSCKFYSNLITEGNYNFDTILSIFSKFSSKSSPLGMFGSKNDDIDQGFFAARQDDSIAKQYAKNSILDMPERTRNCILSNFTEGISIFRNAAIRRITVANSVPFEEFTKKPTAVFIKYRDYIDTDYKFLSLFVEDMYQRLIEFASKLPEKKLERPFIFLLEEFASLPKISSFSTVISACRSRNIFFYLIIQSYAQLSSKYGKDISRVIRDNINIHYFLGSNNVDTKKEFSSECGSFTRFSPKDFLRQSTKNDINNCLETISLVPVSNLSSLKSGEAYICEMNSEYVLFSMLTRCHECKEFVNEINLHPSKEYHTDNNPFDEKYIYYSENNFSLDNEYEKLSNKQENVIRYLKTNGPTTFIKIQKDCKLSFTETDNCLKWLDFEKTLNYDSTTKKYEFLSTDSKIKKQIEDKIKSEEKSNHDYFHKINKYDDYDDDYYEDNDDDYDDDDDFESNLLDDIINGYVKEVDFDKKEKLLESLQNTPLYSSNQNQEKAQFAKFYKKNGKFNYFADSSLSTKKKKH